jgi:hypothetical protein
MISSLNNQMAAWLFTRHNQRSFARKNGNLCWWIQEIPLSKREPKVRILIGIGIDDPFREDRGFGLACLTGDIEPGQICFHFDESPCWWNESEFKNVHFVLTQCGMPAFAHWTETELIRYFEKPIAKVVFASGAVDRKCSILQDRTPVTRNPPIHNLWLSLLHYHQGNYCQSLLHSERWLESVKHLQDGGVEPQRTLNQIADLRSRLTASSPEVKVKGS